MCFAGGYGCGKSIWGVISGIIHAIQFPKSEGFVIRNTIPALKQTTLRFFLDTMPKQFVQDYNKTDRCMTLKNGSVIWFTSADDHKKFESSQISWFLLDEADSIDQKAFDVLGYRLRSPYVPEEYYRGMVVTNPTSKNHWIYKTFTSNDDLFALHNTSSYENAANLPKDYIKTIEATMSPEMAKRFVEGSFSFTPVGIPVFSPDFVPKFHVGEFKYNPYKPIIRGWDFGFRRPACVWLQIDDDNRKTVLLEYLGKDCPLPIFADQVKALSKLHFPQCDEYQDFCDPAGTQASDKGAGETSVQILSKILGDPRYPRFRKSTILEGLEEIRMHLRTSIGGQHKLMIDTGCENLIEGFLGGYHMDDKSGDVPVKDGYYDHLIDCLRYALINLKGLSYDEIIEITDYEYVPNNPITGY